MEKEKQAKKIVKEINTPDLEIKLLLEQRGQLVEGINRTNETFHKTIFALISALVTLIGANIFIKKPNEIEAISLIILQLMIMVVMYITIQLVNGNLQRYYVCAIDDYLYEHYKITCLFYEGSSSRMHAIGKWATLPFMTRSMSLIITAAVIWIVYELNIYSYIIKNKSFLLLLILEVIVFCSIVILNYINKYRDPREYREMLGFLNREYENKMEVEEELAAEEPMKMKAREKLKSEWCEIKKSIKEEGNWIKRKISFKNYMQLEDNTTMFEMVTYWIIFVITLIGFIVLNCNNDISVWQNVILIYAEIVFFFTAFYYSWRTKILNRVCFFVLLPMNLFVNILECIGIISIQKNLGKCSLAFLISLLGGVYILLQIPDIVPYFGEYITRNFPDAPTEAYKMVLIVGFCVSLLLFMLFMYMTLRFLLVIFRPGVREVKVKELEETWYGVRLLFYLLSIIFRFLEMITSKESDEFGCFVSAIAFVLLIDTYIDRRKKCE